MDLTSGTDVFHIVSMPKSMTFDAVTLGDFARDAACGSSPAVELTIKEYARGSGLVGGEVIARSETAQPFGADLNRVTWTFAPTDLLEGRAYGLSLRAESSSCANAIERSWAHNSNRVQSSDESCAILQDPSITRWRLWHTQGVSDAAACSVFPTPTNFDSSQPTGWHEVRSDAGTYLVPTSLPSIPGGAVPGTCATALGATQTAWQDPVSVCQFPQFAAPGETLGDGWYYGLPWSGPGLSGSVRDLYLQLGAAASPTATTTPAVAVTRSSASLAGVIDPNARPTRYRFEWGTGSSLSNSVPIPDADVGSGDEEEAVTASVAGLQPDTTYSFRLVALAKNADPSYGETVSFTTLGLGPNSVNAPLLQGTPLEGERLKATVGQWDLPASAPRFQWQRCNADGDACIDIQGARGVWYPIRTGDVGHTVRARVAVTGPDGHTGHAHSVPSSVIWALAPPDVTVAPTITGNLVEGQVLFAQEGEWSDEGAAFEFQWQRCDASGSECSDVDEATDPFYLLGETEVGARMRLVVRATSSGGTAAATSDATAVVMADAIPESIAPPAVVGDPTVGEKLLAESGSWSPPPTGLDFQWQTCSADGDECVDIDGETGERYDLGPEDQGRTVRVVVVASGPSGDSEVPSAVTPPIVAARPPANSALPRVVGTTRVGQSLSARRGTWSGGPTAYAYLWQRCDAEGDGCSAIDGATSGTYEITPADVGARLRVYIEATGPGGTASAQSPASANVAAAVAPSNTVAPSVTGDPMAGAWLAAAAGVWEGDVAAYEYQWLACDSAGADCNEIEAANWSSLGLDTSIVGLTVRVEVTATGPAGSISVRSEPTVPISHAAAPLNTVAPAISGEAVSGAFLSAAPGTWSPAATGGFSTTWQRCDSGGENCLDSEVSTETYRLGPDDVGATLRVVMIAYNAVGSGAATSQPTAIIMPAPMPLNTRPPTITGEPLRGATLRADAGAWENADQGLALQWERCDLQGGECSAIPDATRSTHKVKAGDTGARLRLRVSASGHGGTDSAVSEPTAPVSVPEVPATVGAPTITGTAVEGGELHAHPGNWGGDGLEFEYEWHSCDETGADCEPLVAAAVANYHPGGADVGGTIRVGVTASNDAGETTALSAPTGVVAGAPPPAILAAPTIAGDPKEGETLAATTGTWSGGSASSRTVQWQRCAPGGGGCVDLGGEDDDTYMMDSDDVGGSVRVEVTASTSLGSTSASSAPTETVTAVGSSALTEDSPLIAFHGGLWEGDRPLALLTTDAGGQVRPVGEDCDSSSGARCPLFDAPAISPDASRVARHSDGAIVTTDPSGNDRQELVVDHTARDAGSSSPAWSSDGKWIAYSGPGSDGTPHIYAVPSDGWHSLPSQLTSTQDPADGGEVDPDYSPDGTQLVYATTGGDVSSRIFIAGADGSDPEPLELGRKIFAVSQPKFSPDGEQIAFFGSLQGAYSRHLFIVDAAGSPPRRVATVHSDDTAAAIDNLPWSEPSCPGDYLPLHMIYFPAAPDFNGDGLACGHFWEAVGGLGHYGHLSWSPDGSSLLYRSCPPGRHCAWWLARRDGSGARRTLPADMYVSAAAYRKATLPRIRVRGGNETYDDGEGALPLALTASDRGSGIADLRVMQASGEASALSAAECDPSCPRALRRSLSLSASGLSEGGHALHAVARNRDGVSVTERLHLLVDRTPPGAPSNLAAEEDEEGTNVSWDASDDPELADGEPGSGVEVHQYRYRLQGTEWSAWSSTEEPNAPIPGAVAEDEVELEVASLDRVRNKSTVTNETLTVHEQKGVEGGVCRETPSSNRVDLHGAGSEEKVMVSVVASIVCPEDSNVQKRELRVCVQVRRDGAWKDWKCESGEKDGPRPTLALRAQRVCMAGTHSYRMRYSYKLRLFLARDVRRTVVGQKESHNCNEAGVFRYLAHLASSPSGLLGKMLLAVNDEPPGSRYGWAAHHMVPHGHTTGDPAQAQAAAYACGIRPNASENGVWLRGPPLRSDKPAYKRLPAHGKRRHYHPQVHTRAHWEWVRIKMKRTVDSEWRCTGGNRLARRTLSVIKRTLELGRAPH